MMFGFSKLKGLYRSWQFGRDLNIYAKLSMDSKFLLLEMDEKGKLSTFKMSMEYTRSVLDYSSPVPQYKNHIRLALIKNGVIKNDSADSASINFSEGGTMSANRGQHIILTRKGKRIVKIIKLME